MIEIILNKQQSISGYTIIEAFPGIGLVGPMAGSYMIEKLEMEYIGRIESEQFPPIVAIHKNTPMFPARIYKSDKYKLLLFISEFTIPTTLVHQLSDELLTFARKYSIKQIISVGGMPAQKPSETIYLTSINKDVIKKALKNGLKQISEGVVAGVSAGLLVKSEQFGIETLNILVEVDPNLTDPINAEKAIKGLNKVLDINIDLNELDNEAKQVEAKIREMLKKVKDSHETYNSSDNISDQGPSMYA
ncbi:MAG: proteasome assembly chaperone family protein [Candidatus Micrarchaeia archaeon]